MEKDDIINACLVSLPNTSFYECSVVAEVYTNDKITNELIGYMNDSRIMKELRGGGYTHKATEGDIIDRSSSLILKLTTTEGGDISVSKQPTQTRGMIFEYLITHKISNIRVRVFLDNVTADEYDKLFRG